MKKIFIGTESELTKHLQNLIDKGFVVDNVQYISDLYRNASFMEDDLVKIFIIITKRTNVSN